MKWLHRVFGLPSMETDGTSHGGGDKLSTKIGGQSFHQMDAAVWSERTRRSKTEYTGSILYIRPNDRLGIDINKIEDFLRSGSTMIVDLHALLHLDTQRRALRKRIGDVASNMGKPAFRIDAEGCLLVVPGRGVKVDQKHHVLGTAIWMEQAERESSPV